MVPVLSIVGRSNSGKTTLIERLVPEFNSKGLRVGVIKHVPHEFNVDIAGKDSYRHKQAGADTIMILSPKHMVVVKDVYHESSLEDSLPYLTGLDMVMTEGFKGCNWPKIEVFRSGIHREPPVCLNDPSLTAIVSDIKLKTEVPLFGVNDTTKISDFIAQQIL